MPITVNLPHPMHLHGHDFYILGEGDGDFTDVGISALNFDNPTRRDTHMLNPGGWLVVAFPTDNPGAWLFHCHISKSYSSSESLLLLVAHTAQSGTPVKAWLCNSSKASTVGVSSSLRGVTSIRAAQTGMRTIPSIRLISEQRMNLVSEDACVALHGWVLLLSQHGKGRRRSALFSGSGVNT